MIAAWSARSQCPVASFGLEVDYCLGESIEFDNTSTNSTEYYWDFCAGELFETPTGTSVLSVTGASDTRGLELVHDGTDWYGFIVDRSTHNLHRIYFGSSLQNTPTQTNLGNIDNLISGAVPIEIVHEAGNWYGLIHNGTSQDIIRLDFGTSLDNDTPTATVVFSSVGLAITHMELENDDGDWVAVLSHYQTDDLSIINFGSSITNVPHPTDDKIVSGKLGVSGPVDLALYYECDQWYGLSVAFDDRSIYLLEFGANLFSSPTITQIASSAFADNPYGVDWTKELGEYVGYVSTTAGQFYRITLGDDLSSIDFNAEQVGSFGGSTMVGTVLRLDAGEWYVFQIQTNGSLYRYNFPLDCDVNLASSTDANPTGLAYSTPGTYHISLRSYNSDSVMSVVTNDITILSQSAPSISFSTVNECLGQTNTFTPVDGGGLTYAWDFDNNGSTDSTDPAPDHTFGSTGDHVVALTVDDGTCTNSVEETVSIFPVPVTPTFFDSGSPYCTGSDITFTNLFDESAYNGATLTYTWDYNGEDTSTDRDGSYNFSTEETKTITLTATIPGCSTTSADSDIDLLAGPTVNFSYGDKCLGDVTVFTDLSTGDGIDGFTWDFGDSNGSTEQNPSHTYADDGDYNVSLTVDNAAGCSNNLTLPLTVDDVPVANFNMGVGCEGQAVGFEDATTVNNANIDTYSWDFGGLGTSSQEDPIFIFETQGNYTVELTVESTYGCTDVVSKNLNVQLAPVAAFSIDLGCLDESTQFLDETETEVENPINTWYWDINGEVVPNTQNPVEIFDTPGDYTATLTVTPSNLCTSTVSHDFTVHELPVADFTYDDACDNQFTAFTDASTSASTSIIAYNWVFDEEGTGNSNPALFRFNETGTYEVSFTVIDDVGCESTTTEDITINPSPTADFTLSSDIGTAPLVIDFTNTSEGATSYLWQFDDPATTTSTETNPQFSYAELGDYDASLIAYNDLGCSDTLMQPIIVADPILDLELVQISSEESDDQTNLTLTVRNSGNVPIHGFRVRVDLENNSSVFEKYNGVVLRNETISYPLNFTFSTLNNNTDYICINLVDLDSNYQDIDIVNNEKCFDFAQNLIIEDTYPNPASGNTSEVRLNLILPTEAPIQIFLMDASGNVLHQDVYHNTTIGLNSIFLDVYPYQQGLYFIKVVYNNIEATQRFMKL